MFVVHIYVETDTAAPRETERKVMYVLEYTRATGELYTKEEVIKKTDTYHGAILGALETALGRINKSCELHLHSRDEYVISSIEKNLPVWEKNGYRTKKGDLVKDHFAWRNIQEKIKDHLIVPEPGSHSYLSWMLSEMARRDGENSGTFSKY